MVTYVCMKQILTILVAGLLLSGCTMPALFVKKPAGLEINTTPAAAVFLNGDNLGPTPYKNAKVTPGTYSLRLLPDDSSLLPYETSLTLDPGVSTVITRTFAATEPDSSGYSLSLVEDVAGKTYLSVITDPDSVNLNVDGTPRGFAPLSKFELNPGSHTVRLTSPGYVEQSLPVNTVKGFNLVVNVKMAGDTINLAAAPSATPSSLASPAPSAAASGSPKPSSTPTLTLERPYVTVSDSPDIASTGGLNVRKEPSASSDPLGKAKIGEKLKYLGETTPAGWHKVEFEGTPGYVSGKYVTLTK